MRNLNSLEKTCKICGKIFYVHLSRKETAKFCSLKCKRAFRTKFCPKGHDKDVVGRCGQGACLQCRRDKDIRRKKRMRQNGNTEMLKQIAKRAYEKQKEKWITKAAQWNKDNPEKANFNQRKSKLLRTYNLTLADYSTLLEQQENKCAICQTIFLNVMHDPHVDHDHKCCSGSKSCGKCVRGLLCQRCNSSLGGLRDNIEALERAVIYLKRFQKPHLSNLL